MVWCFVLCFFFFFCLLLVCFFFFFFFQAEDGIRHGTVTGVQTCALPILFYSGDCSDGFSFRESDTPIINFLELEGYVLPSGYNLQVKDDIPVTGATEYTIPKRSEERRVGKECRSRRSTYH